MCAAIVLTRFTRPAHTHVSRHRRQRGRLSDYRAANSPFEGGRPTEKIIILEDENTRISRCSRPPLYRVIRL